MATLPTLTAGSPLNLDDGVRVTTYQVDTDLHGQNFALDNMPADFKSMDTLSWTYDGRENIDGGDDTIGASIRIVASDMTVLAAADSGGTYQQIYSRTGGSTTDVTRGPTAFAYVNTAATKAQWDGASLQIRQDYSRNMGADSIRIEPDYVAVTGTYTQAASFSQVGFRFRNDDGGEAAATWKAAENTDIELARDTPFRLRFVIDETAGVATSSAGFRFQFRKNGGAWENAASSISTDCIVRLSDHVADEEATTRQLTSGLGSYSPGQIIEGVDGYTSGVDNPNMVIAAGDVTEIEVVAELVSANGTAFGDVFEFRLADWFSQPLPSYNAIPTATVPSPLEIGNRIHHYVAGPWLAPNGSLYMLGDDTTSTIRLWKFDGVDTWSIVASHTVVSASNVQYQKAGPQHLGPFGSKIPIVYWNATDDAWKYLVFDTATDTFTLTDEVMKSPVAVVSANVVTAQIDAYSDGRVIVITSDNDVDDLHVSVRSSIDGAGSWTNQTVVTDTTFAHSHIGLIVDDADTAHIVGFCTTTDEIYYATRTTDGTLTKHTDDVLSPSQTVTSFGRMMRPWIDSGRLNVLLNDPVDKTNKLMYAVQVRTDVLGAGAVWTNEGAINTTAMFAYDPDESPGDRDKGFLTVIAQNPSGPDAIYRVGAIQGSADVIATEHQGGTTWAADVVIYTVTGGVRTTEAPQLSAHATVEAGDVIIRGFIGNAQSLDAVEVFEANMGPPPAGGTTFTQSVAGTVTPAGALATIKAATLALAGSSSPAGALIRSTRKTLTGSVGPGGSLLSRIGKLFVGTITPSSTVAFRKFISLLFAGTITPASTLTRSVAKLLAGTVSSSGALTAIKAARLAVAGVVAPAGELAKRITQSLTGSITPTGVASLRLVVQLALSGAINATGSLMRAVSHTLSGAVTPAGSLTRTTRKLLAGALSTAGTVANQILSTLKTVAVAGALGVTGTVTKLTRKLLDGTITPASSLANQILAGLEQIALAGSIALTGTVSTIKAAVQALTGTLTPAGELARKTSRLLTGSIAPAATLTKAARIALAGTISSAGTVATEVIVGLFQIALAGTVTATGSLIRTTRAIYGGTVTGVGSLTKAISHRLAGSTTPTGTVTTLKAAQIALAGTLTTAGQLIRGAQKALTGSITPVGTRGPTTVAKALTGALTPSGSLVKKLFLELAGTITSSGVVATRFFRIVANAIGARIVGQGRATGTIPHQARAGTIPHQGDASATINTQTNRETS